MSPPPTPDCVMVHTCQSQLLWRLRLKASSKFGSLVTVSKLSRRGKDCEGAQWLCLPRMKPWVQSQHNKTKLIHASSHGSCVWSCNGSHCTKLMSTLCKPSGGHSSHLLDRVPASALIFLALSKVGTGLIFDGGLVI